MPPDERDLRNRLEGALAEGHRLREEVRRLRALLEKHAIPLDEPVAFAHETCLPVASEIARLGTLSDNQAKITLFRSLFRGREDVYAERWRTKEGTWAYRPAGKKDWNALLASRPEEKKKVDRQTRVLYAASASPCSRGPSRLGEAGERACDVSAEFLRGSAASGAGGKVA
jgi:hypothetical protein